ncbi:hypothetical protein [Allobranchiibius sp. GilTou38]|uniref:hypothetical protein n=1 Tax=Allobranchiibius sp. GilTou38 TaxID=2815210 RepID=UPI001AA168C6|nr:hypothetical protein [Allobranchiibius sp. GilTou38]MBO1766587.1 hypothetical protein [Allobranchiibius sp. GilTou38]
MTPPAAARPRFGVRSVGALVGLLSGLLALGPALRPGYLLFYDMVFVPRLDLSDRTLGVDGSVPRAVPNDLVVALASHVVPGWVVQKALLLLVFVGVGAGVGGLMSSRLGAGAAALFASWNAYLAERLAIGHWGFLLGYAALPFLLSAASDVRLGRRRGRLRLGVWTVVTALTGSTGAILGLLVTLAVLLVPGRPGTPDVRRVRRGRETAWAVGVFVLANAPWWFPFLFLAPSASTGAADSAGVTAFMARSDTSWGVFGSLLTGGGIWNAGTWTSGRSSALVSGFALLMVLVCVGYAAWSRAWRASPAYAGLAVAGVICLLVAGAGSLPGGRDLVTAAVTDLPGGGLLRDSQKFVAVWVLLVAVCAGLLAEKVRDLGRGVGADRGAAVGVATLLALWPLVVLTGLAWGQGDSWSAVRYPASYAVVQDRLAALPPGAVAVFPWTLYRRYAFDHDQVVLDPWQRLLDRQVVVNDDLPLSSRIVRGESADAALITRALERRADVHAALQAAGVRYVLLETDQPTSADTALPTEMRGAVVVRTSGLTLYDLGADPDHQGGSARHGAWRYLGLAGLAVTPLLLAGEAVATRRSMVTEELPD